MKQLLEAMEDMELQIPEELTEHAKLLDNPPDIKDGQPFPIDYYVPLKTLWKDETVQKALSRGNEAALPDK